MSVFRVDPSNAMSFSAFGDSMNGASPSILAGDRRDELLRKQAYYLCKQHDHKAWDFDGRPISTVSPRTMQPLLGSEKSWWVPLKMRRPMMTYRLGKIVVDSFTNLLFGENRFPTIRVEGDDQSEDLLQTISRVGKLPLKMVEARNMGGAAGTVGVSWCFHEGRPRFEVHNAADLFVHKWKDRLLLVPEHVTEIYLFSKPKWDGKGFNKQLYWFRRDWMPEADLVFHDEPFDPDPNKVITWKVDAQKSSFHHDGVCHLEWIQNLPADDVDGVPDYDGLYEDLDVVDILSSVVAKGGIANLDPTLKVKMDRMEMDFHGIRKGSENAVVVGKDGDAEYLELGGQSIEAGIKLIESLRRAILETAQCVVPDPHEVAAQGTSSVAMKMMYAPMTSKADILREQYGTAMERILSNIGKVLRDKLGADVVVIDDAGNEIKARFVLDLPQKVEQVPLTDPVTDEETEEEQTHKTDRLPGSGGEVSLSWPPYFAPTPADQGAIATFLSTATGGKPILSQQTAVEVAAVAAGKDPTEEWKRVQAMAKEDQENQAAMMGGDPGGQVAQQNQLPPGATPKPPQPPPPEAGGDPEPGVPHDADLTDDVNAPVPPKKAPPFGG